MPQNDPLLQDALCIERRMSGLCHHGFNGGLCLCKVVRRRGKLCRQGRGYIFQIGQPDVDVPAPGFHALHRLVTAGIAQDRQVQTLCTRNVQRGNDPGLPLPRRDQIDVVGTLRLQVQKDFCQMFNGDLPAEAFGADGIILAEAAFEGAAGEKHRAAAPCTADAGLFPVVQGRTGGFQGAACTAESGASGSTVGSAAARTERAGRGNGNKIGFRHNIQSPLQKVCQLQYTTFQPDVLYYKIWKE